MTEGRLRRALAGGMFLLYALVAGVLLPFHLTSEAAEAIAGVPCHVPSSGAATDRADAGTWDDSCDDPDCHNPAHHHRHHAHDPATCASCSQAKAAASSDAAPVASAPEPAPAGRVDSAPSTVARDGVRAL